MANFDLTNLAVKMICPNNVVKTDDTDLPSVLVYIPKFKNSDVLTGGNDAPTRPLSSTAWKSPALLRQVSGQGLQLRSVQPAGRRSDRKYQLRHRTRTLRGQGRRLAPEH